jgi:S-adenosylmethionine:tRNA ribosyltransferase-isomerase
LGPQSVSRSKAEELGCTATGDRPPHARPSTHGDSPDPIPATVKTQRFDFHLPEHLVPTVPLELRGEARDRARMVVLRRADQHIEHRHFHDLVEYVNPGDVLVINDSMVMQDELKGRCRAGRVTVALCGKHRDGWLVLVRPARMAKRGVVVHAAEGAIRLTLRKPGLGTNMWLAAMAHEGDLPALLEAHGTRHAAQLRALGADSYQNVYGRRPGSLEVPSAGLHFTTSLLARLRAKGVCIAPITLHTGLVEMSPYRHIEAATIEQQVMPEEWYHVPARAARAINAARQQGKRVIAVGTTVVRTLESAACAPRGTGRVMVRAGAGWTDLYLRPGSAFRVVDMVLTNLHQPRSSHIVLVAAFAGAEFTTRAYRAIDSISLATACCCSDMRRVASSLFPHLRVARRPGSRALLSCGQSAASLRPECDGRVHSRGPPCRPPGRHERDRPEPH